MEFNRLTQVGIIIYITGLVIYCASWLPLLYYPESLWSTSAAGLLAPAITPVIWLAGIAVAGQSWPYGIAALLFVCVHVYHNVLAFKLWQL